MDGAIATLVGAGIGAVVVLVLGVLRETWEHRRWLRETRHRLYSDFTEAAFVAVAAHDALWKEWREDTPRRQLRSRIGAVAEVTKPLDTLEGRLSLVGSPAIRDLASSIRHASDEIVWAYNQRPDEPSGEPPTQFRLHWETVDEFVTACRRELGAEGLFSRVSQWAGWKWRRLRYSVGQRFRRGAAP